MTKLKLMETRVSWSELATLLAPNQSDWSSCMYKKEESSNYFQVLEKPPFSKCFHWVLDQMEELPHAVKHAHMTLIINDSFTIIATTYTCTISSYVSRGALLFRQTSSRSSWRSRVLSWIIMRQWRQKWKINSHWTLMVTIMWVFLKQCDFSGKLSSLG